MCACFFFFSSFFATFDFILLINKNAISKKLKVRFYSLFKINAKFQRIPNKQSFLRYIENTTGSVRDFASVC